MLEKHDVLTVSDEGWRLPLRRFLLGHRGRRLQAGYHFCIRALSSAYLLVSAVIVSEKIVDAMLERSNKVGVFDHGYTLWRGSCSPYGQAGAGRDAKSKLDEIPRPTR